MAKAAEFRELTVDELREKEQELAQQLFTLRLQQSVQGQLDNPAKFQQAKRDLARVLTVINEKQRAASASA